MTLRSIYNNTNVPLAPFGTFTGQFEPTSTYLEISAYINSTAYLAVSIQQSQDASTVLVNTTYNYTPTDEVTVFNTGVGLPFYRIILTNEANVQVAHMALTTILTAIPNTAVTATIAGPVTVTGSVVASNLITETLATRRVDFLVVGDYYRVATVGITSGAQWNAIGAIVDGESVPVIGRLFKCLAIGPAVQNGGTCYDVEFGDEVSATITNFPSFPAVQAVSGTVSLTDPTTVRIRDTYGDPIVTTAGNLMVGIGNIYTANPLHTILDSGSVAVSSLPAITGSVSATITTNPVIVKEKPSYTVNLDTVDITSQTIRNTAGCLSGLCLSHVGGSQFCYFKIYNASTATSSDIPLATFPLHKDTTIMIDTHAMNFSGGLCVRGTDNYASNDNVVPSGSLKLVAFVTGYSE
tara:strand:- start:2895 stop:4121 length:1227 start_codon:yes stop_codon:yes gene_type:complete